MNAQQPGQESALLRQSRFITFDGRIVLLTRHQRPAYYWQFEQGRQQSTSWPRRSSAPKRGHSPWRYLEQAITDRRAGQPLAALPRQGGMVTS